MGLLDDMKGLLKQYSPGAAATADAGEDFQQAAESVDLNTVATGIAAAMRSDETPPFAQIVSQLFASGTPDQKMGMLNTLLSSISPEQRNELAALVPALGAASAGTSAQTASALPASAVQTIAQQVEKHDPGIVEKMSALYAAHPTLVRTLGTAAMTIAMREIASRRRNA